MADCVHGWDASGGQPCPICTKTQAATSTGSRIPPTAKGSSLAEQIYGQPAETTRKQPRPDAFRGGNKGKAWGVALATLFGLLVVSAITALLLKYLYVIVVLGVASWASVDASRRRSLGYTRRDIGGYPWEVFLVVLFLSGIALPVYMYKRTKGAYGT
jgi:hypothetical protein